MSETFEGFVQPTKNYFPMPNEWIDICAGIDNLAELKIIQYVLRHTWGFHEYGIPKTISVDEFMRGRKRHDGSRIDSGTGLRSDRSVKDGIKNALAHGYLVHEVDTSDLGRTKKSYALKMIETGVVSTPPVDTTPPCDEYTGVVSTPQTGSIYPPGVQNLPPRRVVSTPRSEKDTLERHSRKTLKEKQEDTGVSAIATPPPAHSFSSSHEIRIATTTPDTNDNETHSHDEIVGDGVAMAIGNDATKGHTDEPLLHGNRVNSREPLLHPLGTLRDTERAAARESQARDETHQTESQTPKASHATDGNAEGTQGVTDGPFDHRHHRDAFPDHRLSLRQGDTETTQTTGRTQTTAFRTQDHSGTDRQTSQGVTADARAADTDVRLPAVHHRAAGSDHSSDAPQTLEGHDAHEPVSASPTALWPAAVVVSPVPPRTRPEETAAQVTHGKRKASQPKPEPTLDEIAFKKRCDALQTRINEDWRGYPLTDKGPMINERVVIKKLVAAFTDTQLAQIHEYLFTRHFKFSKPDYRYTIGAQIMWEQGQSVAQILKGEKANHDTPAEPPKRPSFLVSEEQQAKNIANMRARVAAMRAAAAN